MLLLLTGCGGESETATSFAASDSGSSSALGSSGVIGLASRPVSTTCLAAEAPDSGDFQLAQVWSRVHFRQPIGLVQMPGAIDNDYYLLEKDGRIFRLSADFSSGDYATFLDLRDVVGAGDQGGVLSMAFHPDYPEQPYVYVSYLANEGDYSTRISRFTSIDGTSAIDEEILWTLPQNSSPYGLGSIHKGGSLAFGPDGFLYMSVGDDQRTFSAGDPNLQYGTIIRIDVGLTADGHPRHKPAAPGSEPSIPSPAGYAIPADNPFGNEVYAYGFRNPWRISFDRKTGDLWAGDAGGECFEEINRIQKGGNYGWPNWEADLCGPGGCQGDNTLPVHQYQNAETCGTDNAVTGGYVYRGRLNPGLVGKYIYGDYQTGQVWAYDRANRFNEDVFVEGRARGLAAFGEDNQGELFHIDAVTGVISRIETSARQAQPTALPQRLSQTGCFAELGEQLVPAEGVMRYDIALDAWSDGAEKQRFLSLPEHTSFVIDDDGHWSLPRGAVLIKNFQWQGDNLETRFVVRYLNGAYGTYTYEWTEADDAVLVDAQGKDLALAGGQFWRFPSRDECRQCHTPRAGYVLGLETRQMNIQRQYAATDTVANQLWTFAALDMLSGDIESLPPFPSITDASASLEERVQAYLHVNCASCHRGSGGFQSIWDARFDTAFPDKGLCDAASTTPMTELAAEHYLRPGDHQNSSIWERINKHDQSHSRPHGRTLVDPQAAELVASWVDALADCPRLQF